MYILFILSLLTIFMSTQSRNFLESHIRTMSSMTDSLGVPLIDKEASNAVWEKQIRHVKCIIDPPGVLLYAKTGTIKKGSVTLNVYRSARGSSSLESFHLHLNRFVPGEFGSKIISFCISCPHLCS